MATRPDFTIRQACLSDLHQIAKIVEDEGWPFSKDDVRYRMMNPACTMMVAAIDDGTVLGTCTATQLSATDYSMCFYIVHANYRGLGIGSAVWTALWNSLPRTANIGLLGTDDMAEKYKKKWGLNIEGHKVLCHTTIPKIPAVHSVDLGNIRITELKDFPAQEKLGCYDSTICPIPRTDRIRYIFSNSYRVVMAIEPNTNIVVGYGVITKSPRIFVIGPLYADNDVIARALANHMINVIPPGQRVSLTILEDNKLAIDIWGEYGFGVSDTTASFGARAEFTKRSYSIPRTKVYSLFGTADYII